MGRSSFTCVVITDSFSDAAHYNHLPADKKRTFGEDLPSGAIGISWSGTSASNLFFVPAGDMLNPTEWIPLLEMADGVIHPCNPGKIVNGGGHNTTARNIVIHY